MQKTQSPSRLAKEQKKTVDNKSDQNISGRAGMASILCFWKVGEGVINKSYYLEESRLKDKVVAAVTLLAISCLLHYSHLFYVIGDVNNDFYLHYNWAKEFSENLLAGDWYPRWMFHGRYGLGEPVFITYSPLHYYVISFFGFLGLSTWNSMQLSELVPNFIFAWFVYLAAISYISHRGALLVAAVVLLNPFLIMLHYKFHGFSWGGVAYLSHGMLLWALTRRSAFKSNLNKLAAVAIGLSVGAHILSALMNLICYSFYCLAITTKFAGNDRVPFIRVMTNWGLTVIVGLLLSAAYLFPALYNLDYINTNAWLEGWRTQHFVWPLFTQTTWMAFQWPIPTPAIVMFIIGSAYFYIHKGQFGRFTLPFFGALAASAATVFLSTELSYPVWMFHNPISQINLPFRFISLSYTLTAFALGFALHHAYICHKKYWFFVILSSLLLSFLTGALSLYKAAYIDAVPLPSEVLNEEYTFKSIKHGFHDPDYFSNCAADTDQCVETYGSAAGFRGVWEYELRWAGPDYVKYAQKGFVNYCNEQGMNCLEPKRSGTGLELVISLPKRMEVVLPIFSYPAWKVAENGMVLEQIIDADTGLIQVSLEKGDHVLTIYWAKMEVEKIGLYVTFSVLVLLVLLWVFGRRRAFRY
ncbi:MAG: hypothetical protein V7677_14660 [Motiliproteus sp.]